MFVAWSYPWTRLLVPQQRSGFHESTTSTFVSEGTPVSSAATIWFPRVCNFHFCIRGHACLTPGDVLCQEQVFPLKCVCLFVSYDWPTWHIMLFHQYWVHCHYSFTKINCCMVGYFIHNVICSQCFFFSSAHAHTVIASHFPHLPTVSYTKQSTSEILNEMFLDATYLVD
jgi:hypothetical protein